MLEIFEILLMDRTTGNNILWANAERETEEIQLDEINLIKPRHEKVRAQQKQRTRDRAEIFTPPEICKLQNDLINDAWLKKFVIPWLKDKENLHDDLPTAKAIIEGDFKKIADVFFNRKTETPIDTIVAAWLAENKDLWQAYIDAKFLEITCGEAPYLVNRYNAVTGETIEIQNRGGLLDRKLQLINKEISAVSDWLEFTLRAVKSVYGYEFQGDNLFLARKNIFETVKDFYHEKFSAEPPEDFLKKVAEIISWNIWQMDGLTYSPPFTESANLFGGANCKIKDWKTGKIFEFQDLVKGARQWN